MKILVAEETAEGFNWAIHVDESKTVPNPAFDPRETLPDPKYLVIERWAPLLKRDGESVGAYAARKAEYVAMQKRELQFRCDALTKPAAAAVVTIGDIQGQSIEKLA